MTFRLPTGTPPPIEHVLDDDKTGPQLGKSKAQADIDRSAQAAFGPPAIKPLVTVDAPPPSSVRIDSVSKDIVVGFRIQKILRKVSLDIAPGITLLFGPNGAGKTTLLKLLSGRLLATHGSISLLGPCANSTPFFAVEGGAGLFDGLSVSENLRLIAGTPQGLPWPPEVQALLVQINPNVLVRRLSRGQRQSVLLAAACLTNAPLVLLDEPTNGLDPARRELFRTVLASWRASGRTVVIASHDLELQSDSDAVGYISNGKVVGWGAALGKSMQHAVRMRFEDTPSPECVAAFPGNVCSGKTLVLRNVLLSELSSVIGKASELGAVEIFAAPSAINDLYFEDKDDDATRD